ncbi:MAG: nicotinamide mononucleotide transporter [Escherichia coli]
MYGWVFGPCNSMPTLLQLFFIVTSITGWIHWLKVRVATSCRCAEQRSLFPFVALCCRRGRRLRLLLHTTNAWAPWLDSLILTFSVLAQFMLMGRRIENWYVWLAVNTRRATVYNARFKPDAGLFSCSGLTPGMVCINGAKSCKHHEAFCNGSGGW